MESEGRGTTAPSGLRAGPERGRGAAGRPAMAGGREHRVGPGDTLPGLALRYGVTVSAGGGGRGSGLSPQRAPRRHCRPHRAPALVLSRPHPTPHTPLSLSPSSSLSYCLHPHPLLPSLCHPAPSHPTPSLFPSQCFSHSRPYSTLYPTPPPFLSRRWSRSNAPTASTRRTPFS